MDRSSPFKTRPPEDENSYYSVEFAIEGCAYQFKLWNIPSMPMCVLVKEGSNILGHLKVGNKFDLKYYSNLSAYGTECIPTSIQDIIKDDQGRFKGHYLVALGIQKG
jgi:hypothetical protein